MVRHAQLQAQRGVFAAILYIGAEMKAEVEALSDDELRKEIEKAPPEMRRKVLKIAVSWLRGSMHELRGTLDEPSV